MLLASLPANLSKKIGIRDNDFVLVINQPEYYFELLSDLPSKVRFVNANDNIKVDALHIFALNQNELTHELFTAKPLLKPEGKLWIFFPKKSSRFRTDLNITSLINHGIDLHLTNIQIIDFDLTWSAMEFCQKRN